jgi:hypothetical protein
VQRDIDRVVEVAWQVEVERQEVAGAGGEDRQGHAAGGQAGDAGHHGAVAARSQDQVHVLLDGLAGEALARLLLGRLQPHHLDPGRVQRRLQVALAFGRVVGGGGRVEDHRDPAHGGLRGSGRLGWEPLSHGAAAAA